MRIQIATLVAALLVGVAALSLTHAESGASPPVQIAAAPPEVWEEAFDDAHGLRGDEHARFAFTVPAGNYLVTAKLVASAVNSFGRCHLSAGGNVDKVIFGAGFTSINTPGSTGWTGTLSFSVAHRFTNAGEIVLDCWRTSGVVILNHIKMHATRVNAITFVEP